MRRINKNRDSELFNRQTISGNPQLHTYVMRDLERGIKIHSVGAGSIVRVRTGYCTINLGPVYEVLVQGRFRLIFITYFGHINRLYTLA